MIAPFGPYLCRQKSLMIIDGFLVLFQRVGQVDLPRQLAHQVTAQLIRLMKRHLTIQTPATSTGWRERLPRHLQQYGHICQRCCSRLPIGWHERVPRQVGYTLNHPYRRITQALAA